MARVEADSLGGARIHSAWKTEPIAEWAAPPSKAAIPFQIAELGVHTASSLYATVLTERSTPGALHYTHYLDMQLGNSEAGQRVLEHMPSHLKDLMVGASLPNEARQDLFHLNKGPWITAIHEDANGACTWYRPLHGSVEVVLFPPTPKNYACLKSFTLREGAGQEFEGGIHLHLTSMSNCSIILPSGLHTVYSPVHNETVGVEVIAVDNMPHHVNAIR